MRAKDLLAFLRSKGLRPKKAWGQNFLIDDNTTDRIVEAASVSSSDFVVEVGGGHGVLSVRLAERCRKLVVVEKDRLLAEHLRELFKDATNVEVVEGDVLKLDFKNLFCPKAVLVSNLPYSISSPFMFKLWDLESGVERFVLMFQKEVAERLTAPPGTKSYGILTVLFSLAFDVKLLFTVSRNAFWPRPEVDSAVVLGTRRCVLSEDIKRALREVLNAAFPYRRKKLSKALRLGLRGLAWMSCWKRRGFLGM